jgi:hypothetical protein
LTTGTDAATPAVTLFRERVAQPVEHLTFNQEVAGSIPAALTNKINELVFEKPGKENACPQYVRI